MHRIVLAAFALLLTVIPAQSEGFPALPDRRLTPGVVRHDLTLATICSTKWGKDERHVTAAMKRQVFANYGLSGNQDRACVRDKKGRRCEIDHLISRELGGADDVKNLWPQPYGTRPWNAALKDRVENRLHKELCETRSISLRQARREIASDWRVPYIRYFGDPTTATPRRHRR
jgi:hypothetical protein